MRKFGFRFVATGLVAGMAFVSTSGQASADSPDFIQELLESQPSYEERYDRGSRYDYDISTPPPVRRAPTNIATVRSKALPPEPYVALMQRKLKPAKNMDVNATAVHEYLTATLGTPLRVRQTHRKEIIAFYKERDFKPRWFSPYGIAKRAKLLLELMSNAEEEGLRAQDYLPGSLSGFSDQLDSIAGSPSALAKFEIELTAAALEYSHHISAGRVKPSRISKLHTLAAKPVAPKEVLHQLGSNLRADTYLASLHPMIPQYGYLKMALAKFRNKSKTEEVIYVPAGSLIRAGSADSRLELIAGRLKQMGFYSMSPKEPKASEPNDSMSTMSTQTDNTASEPQITETPQTTEAIPGERMVYDADLIQAVKDMQEQAGLRRDGVIGNRTIAALNAQSGVDKIEKILLTMERLRWLPQDLTSKYVFVNQAFYETWMMDNGKEIFRSDVIVGKPLHQTAVFSDTMERVVLNPRWYVPRSIIYNEMIPKLYNNPYYLQDQGYEVMDVRGNFVDSASVNWGQYTQSTIPYNVRQPSGPRNALGRVKFLFPNKHAIYMHDTPSRSLFKRTMRSLSHGCVRVQKPIKFAEIILGTEGWSRSKIERAIATGQNQTVELSTKIPVYLGYYTAWADAKGNVQVRNDVYKRDRTLTHALKQNDQARTSRQYALNN